MERIWKKRERESATLADEVVVNGVAINGSGFTLDFGALDITADTENVDRQTARKIAEANARQWVATGSLPKDPFAKVTAAIRAYAAKQGKKQKPLVPFTPTLDLNAAVEGWNQLAKRIGRPPAPQLDRDLAAQLDASVAEVGGLGGWHEMLGKAERSPFLLKSGWFKFAWLCKKPGNALNVPRGDYEDNDCAASSISGGQQRGIRL